MTSRQGFLILWRHYRGPTGREKERQREEIGGEAMKDDFFTVNELAEHFGVNPKTIYRRLWAKGIPAFKIGRSWRIAKKDIIWLKQ